MRYCDRLIQKKLEEGYKPRGPMAPGKGGEDFLAEAHRHLSKLGKKR